MITIRVQLVLVGNQSAVISIFRDAVIIIIVIASISFPISIVVSLVSIGYVWAVIHVILMSIFIYVLVVIALVPNEIIIYIRLQKHDGNIMK